MIRPIETLRVFHYKTLKKNSLVVTVSALPIIPEGYADNPNGTEIVVNVDEVFQISLICILFEIALKRGFIRPERIGGVGNSWMRRQLLKHGIFHISAEMPKNFKRNEVSHNT
jgi:hypothetical protein